MLSFPNRVLASVCVVACPWTVQAFESSNLFPGDQAIQSCYGAAMVGMDSVINSRLGVVPEDVLHLARVNGLALSDERFSTDLLNTIMHAYLWEGTPHSYAVNVFYGCAQDKAPLRSAAGAH